VHELPGIEDMTVKILYPRSGRPGVGEAGLDPPAQDTREDHRREVSKMVVCDDYEPLKKFKIYDKSVEMPAHYEAHTKVHYSHKFGHMIAACLRQFGRHRIHRGEIHG
jgi:hypothetical protein